MSAAGKLNLATIGGGDLSALVDRAIAKVCENVADPNIKTEAIRKIKIAIKIKPDKNGQMAQMQYEVKTEVPGPEPGQATAYIAMDQATKEITLYPVDLRQTEMFGKEPHVTEIRPVGDGPRVAPGPAPAAFAPPMAD